MLDDWADWEEDLEEGSYNCLLASIRKHLQLSTDSTVTPEMVKQQLYVHDFFGLLMGKSPIHIMSTC